LKPIEVGIPQSNLYQHTCADRSEYRVVCAFIFMLAGGSGIIAAFKKRMPRGDDTIASNRFLEESENRS